MHHDIKAALDPHGILEPRQGVLTRDGLSRRGTRPSSSSNAFGCSMLVAWPAFSMTADVPFGVRDAAAAACSHGQNSLSRPAMNTTGTGAAAMAARQSRFAWSFSSSSSAGVKPAFAALRSIAFSRRAMRTGPFEPIECRPGSGMPVAKSVSAFAAS